MKPTVFRYTLYSIIAVLAFNSLHLFIIMPRTSYDTSEFFGYLTMTLSMIFVFFGVKYYRDRVNNGSLRFGEGLKIGLLIVLGPALFFALFDMLYIEVINPSWQDDYFTAYLEKVKANTPPDQLDAKLKKVQEQKEFFSQPVITFLVMFVTIFIIGAIVSIISALTLRRNKRGAVAN
jgi:small-conductance mechanosensitive channel